MGNLIKMLQQWVDNASLSEVAKVSELILVVVLVMIFLISLGIKFARAESCYECGKRFTPGLDTPMPTRSWPMAFCSDGCKVDYRMSRI